MEIWGFCETCRHWFYCPTWSDRIQRAPRCSQCAAEPATIQNRAGVPSRDGSHLPAAYCPACSSAWFEAERPLSSCPRCGASAPLRSTAAADPVGPPGHALGR